jgi:hypothetical protein
VSSECFGGGGGELADEREAKGENVVATGGL